MKAKQYPSQAELRALFDYKDGQLIRYGRPVGVKRTDGYLKCNVKNKTYLVHRLIYMYHNGYTDLQIDHINGNKQDNRISNLKAVTNTGNQWNQLKSRGWFFRQDRNKFTAYISSNNKRTYLGHFSTECGARLAYLNAKLGRTLYGRS